MVKIVCGPENVREFNRLMKAVVPEFHALAKELHAAGLLNGLRGATLEIGQFDEPEKTQPPTPQYCKKCRRWHIPPNCGPAKEAP